MVETLTPEQKKIYLAELKRVAQKVYQKDYHTLCLDRKIIIQKLVKTGDF